MQQSKCMSYGKHDTQSSVSIIEQQRSLHEKMITFLIQRNAELTMEMGPAPIVF